MQKQKADPTYPYPPSVPVTYLYLFCILSIPVSYLFLYLILAFRKSNNP